MAKKLLARHHKFREWYLALGGIVVAFILGCSLLLPLWDKRTGFDVLVDVINGDGAGRVVGGEVVIPEPYIYESHSYPGGVSRWVVNETYFLKWLDETVTWRVQKSTDNVLWKDYSKFDVKKDWDGETQQMKYTIIVTSDQDAYYRVITNTDKDKQLMSYEDKSVIGDIGSRTNDFMMDFRVADSSYKISYNWDDYLRSDASKTSTFSKSVTSDISNKQSFSWDVVSNVKIKSGATYTIDPTYGLIGDAVVNSWEYDEQEGLYPSMIRLGTSEYYAIVSTGDTGTQNYGYIRTIRVWDSNGTIKTSLVDYLKFDTATYLKNFKIFHVSDDIYGILYYNNGDTNRYLVTISIDDADGNIAAAVTDKQLIKTFSYYTSDIVHISGIIYAIIFTDASTDLFLQTWNISAAGDIGIAYIDSVEIDDTDAGQYIDMCMVDSDTVAVVYDAGSAGGNDGYMSTWNISDAGDITNTRADFWEFDTVLCGTPTIAKVDGTTYMVAYEDTNADLYVKTCTIDDTGDITAAWIDTQAIDTTNGDYPTFFNVSLNSVANKWVKGISFSGEGSDGYISTFDVTGAGVIGSEIDTLETVPADTVGWYMPVCYVANNYFLVINQDSSNDGWAKTVEIFTNQPPVVGNPSPIDGAVDVGVIPQLSADITGNGKWYLNSSWYSNSSGNWVEFGSMNTTHGYGAISNVISSYEYDGQEGRYPDVVKLGSDGTFSYYAIVCTGDTGSENDGYIRTIRVWESNGTIYPGVIESYEYDGSDGNYPKIIHVSGDVYAIAYGDTAKVTVVTVGISSVGDIDTVTGLIDSQVLTNAGSPRDFIHFTGDTFCVQYRASDLDGWFETVNITSAGVISGVLDFEEFDTTNGLDGNMIVLDSGTVAVAYQDSNDDDAFIFTYEISAAGIITDAPTDTWTVTTDGGSYIKIFELSDTFFCIAYRLNTGSGVLKTFSISDAGVITKSFIDSTTIFPKLANYNYPIFLGDTLYAVSYSWNGGEGGGWISTINISDDGYFYNFKLGDSKFNTDTTDYESIIIPVVDDYYLVVYSDSTYDGLACTVEICNATNTTIRQTNSNFSAFSTKYWWSVNCTDGVQWTNETFCFTTIGGGKGWQVVSSFNGSVFNSSNWYQVQNYNGTVFNVSVNEWNTVVTWNGTIYNNSLWKTLQTFNGTIWNQSNWYNIIDYNGTIYNNSNWNNILDYNGTIYNASNFNIINNWNGSIYNETIWKTLQTFNGTIFNTSNWYNIIDINGTIFNHSSWNNIIDYNGSIYNTTDFSIISNYNGSVFNVTDYQTIKDFNGTIFNSSSWHQFLDWNGSVFNNTFFSSINDFNGTIYNLSSWFNLVSFNGTVFNSSGWYDTFSWNGTVYNTSKWVLTQSFNGTIYNVTNYQTVSDFNGSIFNLTIETWRTIITWNGTIFNQSHWYTILDYNGTIYNTSNWNTILEYNGTIYNIGNWNTIININGTIYNLSIYHIIDDYNGTLFNISIEWNNIINYNGTIYNITEAHIIDNWNGTIYNHTIVYIWIENPYPVNNSKNIDLSPVLYGTFMNLVGHNMNISWYYGNSSSTTTHWLINTTGIVNQTVFTLLVNASHYSHWYYWRVNVTDTSGRYLNETFRFKTETHYGTGMIRNIKLNEYMLIAMIIAFAFALFFFKRRRRKPNDEYLPINE